MKNISINKESELEKRLINLENKQFTGVLKIQSKSGKSWQIYLCLSRIIWADGGFHCNRSWRRLWLKYCGDIDINKLTLSEDKEYECWNYHLLTYLAKKQIVKKEQVTELIKEKINEVLFDIRQTEAIEEIKYGLKQTESTDVLWDLGLSVSFNPLTIDSVLKTLKESWEKWEKLNLTTYSPNYAPILIDHDKLQETVSPVVYKNFQRILNGKFALRTLAGKMNQDLIKLTFSLSNYIKKGWVELIEIPDLSDDLTPLKTVKFSGVQNALKTPKNTPFIVCIDDSPQVTEIMEKIVTGVGYKYLAIRDPLQAVATLLENSPDVIFLDLVMPIVNGYELCAQIRRVSKLANVPIIILTGNDGLVDRVRSKMAGSTEFMAKPIVKEEVLDRLEKVLSKQKNKGNNDSLTAKSNASQVQFSAT